MPIDSLDDDQRGAIQGSVKKALLAFSAGNFSRSLELMTNAERDHNISADELLEIASNGDEQTYDKYNRMANFLGMVKLVRALEEKAQNGERVDSEAKLIYENLKDLIDDLNDRLDLAGPEDFPQLRDESVALRRVFIEFLSKLPDGTGFRPQVSELLKKLNESGQIDGKDTIKQKLLLLSKRTVATPETPPVSSPEDSSSELWELVDQTIVDARPKLLNLTYDPRTDVRVIRGANQNIIYYTRMLLAAVKSMTISSAEQSATIQDLEKLVEDLENRSKEIDETGFQNWVSQIVIDATTSGTPLHALASHLTPFSPTSYTNTALVDAEITAIQTDLTNARSTYSSVSEARKVAHLNETYFDKADEQINKLREVRDFIDWKAQVAQLVDLINEFQALLAQPDTQRFELKDKIGEIQNILNILKTQGSRPMSSDGSVNQHIIDGIKDLEFKAAESVSQYGGKHPDLSFPDSVTVHAYRGKSLYSLFRDWYTDSIVRGGEAQRAYEKVLQEKFDEIGKEFIAQAISLLPPTATNVERSVARTEAIERYRNFVKLVEMVSDLIDFGILQAKSLNTAQLTAKYDDILAKASNSDAMQLNTALNNHPLVRVGGLSPTTGLPSGLDLETQSSQGMGVVQKICYVAFQEMQKLPYNEREIEDALSKYNANPSGYDYKAEGLPPVIINANGIPVVTSAFDDQEKSVFSRNQGFSAETSTSLFEAILNASKITTREGSVVDVKIVEELKAFPPEARKLVMHVAMQKATRDSLGEDAGAIHLGLNKGAYKFDGGSEAKPRNVLAGILYQVGKNKDTANYLAMLQWVDLEDYALMSKGRPANPGHRKNYKKWSNPNNERVILMTEYVRRYDEWTQPAKYKVKYRRTYTPKKWYEDAPRLSEFFNKTESPRLASDYTKSIEAILRIIEKAAGSVDFSLGSITDQLKQKVQVEVAGFNTEIGKAMGYIGPYMGPGSEYGYVHEMIIAAYHEFLANLLGAVPSGGEMKFGSVVAPGLTNREYKELYRTAVETAIDTIQTNTTVASYWPYLIGTGTDPHYLKQNFEMKWRRAANASADLQYWIMKNVPDAQPGGVWTGARKLSDIPHSPINIDRENPWKSSYEYK